MRHFHRFLLLAPVYTLIACGSWAGNGEKDKDKGDDEAATGDRTLLAGDVIYHKVTVGAGGKLAVNYTPTTSTGLRLAGDTQNFEVSVIDPYGQEITYNRQSGDGLSVDATATEAGEYVISIKSNGDDAVQIENTTTSEVEEDKGMVKALEDAAHSDISLKAVVVLARQCKQYADGGNSTTTRTAPDGEAFIQPFVFLGKVDLETRKVTRVDDASISLVGGSTTMSLSRLDDFDLSVFRETGGLTKAEHVEYTRSFYQGYFGAAGEFYTVDTFLFGGDCSKMPTFVLNSNPGDTDLQLKISSTTLDIDQSFALRPTVSTSFTLYESADKKLDNWDPCSYDAFTAEPKNYNHPTEACRELDPSNPPYVTLDYLLPSQQYPTQYTSDSDPTRILYYGHSLSRAFKEAIIDQQDELRTGAKTSISLDHCMNNGGINSVAISKEPSYLPLKEYNMAAGDLIQLSHKTGSYTALTQYFQGNADISGSVRYPACIPNTVTQASCDDYKVLTVESKDCHIKADSGVFVTSLQDNFIYPSYYSISGSLKK